MKKLILGVIVASFLFSFSPVVKAQEPLQQELTQADKDVQIQLLLQMIAILRQMLQMMQLQASAIENIGIQSTPVTVPITSIPSNISDPTSIIPALLPTYTKSEIARSGCVRVGIDCNENYNSWPVSAHAYNSGNNTTNVDFSGNGLTFIYKNLGTDCRVVIGDNVIITRDITSKEIFSPLPDKSAFPGKYSYQLQCHQDGREDSIFIVPFAEEWDGGYQYAK